MKIIVLGYHNIGCKCLEFLIKRGEDIVAVFTHNDNPDENIFFDNMVEISEPYGIPCYIPENINSNKWVSMIKKLSPDIIFSFYFRDLVSKEILDIPRLGAINLHGSLLPKYRGRCPVNWALINNEKETGVTLHYMTEKPDAGDMIAQRRIPISFADTAFTLLKKVEKEAVIILKNTCDMIKEGRNLRIPQDVSKASYYGGRKPNDGRICWQNKSVDIYNLVRAVTHPWPGAFCFFRNKKLFVWECEPVSICGHKPGTLISFDHNGIVIAAGYGAVLVKKCQIIGNDEIDAHEFSKLYSLQKGDLFL